MLESYTRVKVCPICGKSRCLVSNDGEIAVCHRVAAGAFKVGKGGKFVHKLDGDEKPKGTTVKREPEKPVDYEYWHRWISIAKMRYHDSKANLGKVLGLSEASLRQLDIGVLGKRELAEMNTACKGLYAWSFPMYNEHRRPIGIRLRSRDGFKYSCTGSHNGMFYPHRMYDSRPNVLHVVEGPTDMAAMIDLGKIAIGRPMNNGLEPLIRKTIQRINPGWVTIIIDQDEPMSVAERATVHGANMLAAELGKYHIENNIIHPPPLYKDMREYRIAEGTTP